MSSATSATPGAGTTRGRGRRLLGPAAVLTAAVASTAYLAAVDPNEPGHYPTCPFFALTGAFCPGCGTLRAIHALATGDLAAAVSLNVLTVLVVPLLIAAWLRWTWRVTTSRPQPSLAHPVWGWAFLAAVMLFWVVRNLPGGEFLAP